MNILTIISRDLQKASTLYRVVQYVDFLKSHGIDFKFVNRKALCRADLPAVRSSDLLFNQKCLFRYSLAKKMIQESRRTIFEFDDAIFTRPGKPDFILTRWRENRRLHLWLKQADVITTPNEFLADYARRFSNSVEVLPMALDLRKWQPRKKKTQKKGVVIGWAGSPATISLLEGLDSVLSSILKKHSNITIAVFSGKKPRLNFPFHYHPFQPGHEPTFIQGLDIGLLPLQNDTFMMGKSPIKAIQYLSCGVPVVGNSYGATREILNEENSIAVTTNEEWRNALERLIGDPGLASRMGESGRVHMEANHDMAKVREQFLRILRQNG